MLRSIAVILVGVLFFLDGIGGPWVPVLGVIALYLLMTSFISFSPLYRLFSLSTIPHEPNKDQHE